MLELCACDFFSWQQRHCLFLFFFNVAVFRLMLGLPLYLYWDTRKFRLTIIPVQLDKFSVNVESYFNDIAVKVTVKC